MSDIILDSIMKLRLIGNRVNADLQRVISSFTG